jgi:hypothetical protein
MSKPIFSGSKSPTVIPTLLLNYSRKWLIQDGGRQFGSTRISTCTHDSSAIPKAKPLLSVSRNPTVTPTILSNLTGSDKSKMAATNSEVLISPLVHVIVTQFTGLNLRCLYYSLWRSYSNRRTVFSWWGNSVVPLPTLPWLIICFDSRWQP